MEIVKFTLTNNKPMLYVVNIDEIKNQKSIKSENLQIDENIPQINFC